MQSDPIEAARQVAGRGKLVPDAGCDWGCAYEHGGEPSWSDVDTIRTGFLAADAELTRLREREKADEWLRHWEAVDSYRRVCFDKGATDSAKRYRALGLYHFKVYAPDPVALADKLDPKWRDAHD